MSKTAYLLLVLVLLASILLFLTLLGAALAETSDVPSTLLTPAPTEGTTSTITPTPTLPPTPVPTIEIVPGSPLVFGNQFLTEMISQFDITKVAELVLAVLAVVWVIVILVYVDREFIHKETKKQEKSV